MQRKVLIIVENLPVPFDTRVWQEATTLAENGYLVSVICPKGKGYDADYEYLNGVHVHRHDLPPEGNPPPPHPTQFGSFLFFGDFSAFLNLSASKKVTFCSRRIFLGVTPPAPGLHNTPLGMVSQPDHAKTAQNSPFSLRVSYKTRNF